MNYLEYQLKVSGLLLIFYAIFWFFLRGSIHFKNKRIYILGSFILAFVVPFVKVNFTPVIPSGYYQNLPEVIIEAYSSHKPAIHYFDILPAVLLIIISFLFLYHLVKQIITIYVLIDISETYDYNGLKIVETEGQEAFTFFHYIFIGKQISPEDRSIILEHESIHASKLHSIDLLLVNLVMLMQWFNPAVWLFKRAMKQNHEYEADRILLNQGTEVLSYQQLLLNQAFQTQGVRFSSFNYNSFIKNRIKMMTKTKSSAGRTRFLLAIVMSLFAASIFSFKSETITHVENEIIKKPSQVINSILPKDTIKTVKEKSTGKENMPYLAVDDPATFNGKDLVEFNKYVMSSVKYPEEAMKNKWEGKVYVQFVVETDGSIKDADVLRSTGHKILDDEAVRVIKNGPKWKPAMYKGNYVRQIFTFPVVFKITE